MKNLIVKNDPKSPISEAYRTLRTNIQFASYDKTLKVMLVTSSGPSEGKTTTSSNLALTFSNTGKKVLLIDCDLRKPSIHKTFNISNIKGLSNLLIGEIEFGNVVQEFEENLHIITSGTIPPNPSEMLMSNKMKSFIEDMRQIYDYIIVDTPPVIAVTDAQIISTMVDGCILVVSSGEANKDAAVKSKELLDKVGSKILGVVLNKVDIKSKGKYGYGYYYYEYGEHKGKESKKA